jgi:hypothetical protein
MEQIALTAIEIDGIASDLATFMVEISEVEHEIKSRVPAGLGLFRFLRKLLAAQFNRDFRKTCRRYVELCRTRAEWVQRIGRLVRRQGEFYPLLHKHVVQGEGYLILMAADFKSAEVMLVEGEE